MGSLMDGIEVADKGKGTNGRGGGRSSAKGWGGDGSTESGKTVKLVIAIVCLTVGGGLIAWNMGLLGGDARTTIDPSVASEVAGTPTTINPINRPPAASPDAPPPARSAVRPATLPAD